MARREIILAKGQFYHIFNRGVEKRPIFTAPKEFGHFLETIKFYQRERQKKFSDFSPEERTAIINKPEGQLLVEIICYCLMPNHFHFMLRQVIEGGITTFVKKISDSYSRYFNLRHERVGSLFQGNFKAVRIEKDTHLLHVSRYIHFNPAVSYLVDRPEDYQWSSYNEYLGLTSGFCQKDVVLGQFKSLKRYRQFVLDQVDYARKLKALEHLWLEKEP